MLKALADFERYGPVTLGLNQNEANILARLCGVELPLQPDSSQAMRQANQLRNTLGICEVVIHGHRYAVGATSDGIAETSGPYCPQPVKSTGAGDRFNAGYALGLMLDLPSRARLQLAAASSGLYVRLGRSPTPIELAGFIDQWDIDAL